MWKYIAEGWEPITGTEARDYTDPEFEELEKAYAAYFGSEEGALAESGHWKHEPGGPRVRQDKDESES